MQYCVRDWPRRGRDASVRKVGARVADLPRPLPAVDGVRGVLCKEGAALVRVRRLHVAAVDTCMVSSASPHM